MFLCVELKAELFDQGKLCFQEVDVLLLVRGQFLKQDSRHPVVGLLAMARGLQLQLASVHFRCKIAFQNLLDVFPDPQLVERLHVGLAV